MSDNYSQCPSCGNMAALPNGTFISTFNGLVKQIVDSPEPQKKVQELLAQALGDKDTMSKIARLTTIAVLMTISALYGKELVKGAKIEISANFFNQYNQTIIEQSTAAEKDSEK